MAEQTTQPESVTPRESNADERLRSGVGSMPDNSRSAMDAVHSASGPGWWVLATRLQHEKRVAGQLRARGVEVFLPLYESIRRANGRCLHFSLPLFAGYLFVRNESSARPQLLATSGLHKMVSRDDQWVVVAEQEIRALRQALEAPHRVEPHPYVQRGQRVRVRSGALEGLEGFVIRRNSTFRLVLSVDVLARAASVEVSGCDIELLKHPPLPASTGMVAGSVGYASPTRLLL